MGETHMHRRGSILDLFLVFLLIFSLVGVGLRWFELEQTEQTDNSEKFLVQGVVAGVDPRMLNSITVGDALYTSVGEYYGRVTAFEAKPSRVRLLFEGEWREGAWEETRQCDLYVTVMVEGRQSDGRILHRLETELLVGERIELYSEVSMLSLIVQKIDSYEVQNEALLPEIRELVSILHEKL